MLSSAYTSQSSWDLYEFFVFDQNTSEGICDALLAVSESMRQFAPETSMPESALVALGKHISQQTLKFVKDDNPDLGQHQRGLYKNLWSNRYLASTSRGLKQSIEKITIRFIEDITKSFSESSTGWTYTPDLVHDAFKELAVSFENALGREYDDHQKTVAASAANGIATLSASLHTLSISSSQPPASAPPAANTTPARSSSSDDCFNCGQPGHWTSNYPSPQKGSITPPRSSASSPSGDCYTCGQPGHWSRSCPSPRRGSATTPSRTPHMRNASAVGRPGTGLVIIPGVGSSATPSRSTRDKCFRVTT